MNCELKNNECVFRYLIGSISEKELNDFKKVHTIEADREIKLESVKDADLTNFKIVIVISPEHKEEIGRAVAALKEKNAEYCYYLFFMENYRIASWTLRTLEDTVFDDANGNTIKFEQSPATFWVEFVGGNGNEIVLGKGFFSVNLHILCTGSKAKIAIGKNTVFKNCIMECGNYASIKIGSYCNIDDKCEILCGNDNFYLVDGQKNTIEVIENKVTVNEHVKIGKNSTIIKGADIGSGAIIAPCSVVDSPIPPCALASGNRAAVVRSNVSWAIDGSMGKSVPSSLYDIKDRYSLKYFSQRKTVFIHGSCVSRNTLEYSSTLTIKYHLFRNPIHTMLFKGINIAPDEIKGNDISDFGKRNLLTEFNKNQLNLIQNNISDYYTIDLADIRFGYLEFVNFPDKRLYSVDEIDNTVAELEK